MLRPATSGGRLPLVLLFCGLWMVDGGWRLVIPLNINHIHPFSVHYPPFSIHSFWYCKVTKNIWDYQTFPQLFSHFLPLTPHPFARHPALDLWSLATAGTQEGWRPPLGRRTLAARRRQETLAKARRQEPRPLRVCALQTATKNTNYLEVSEIVRIFADEIKKGYGNNGIQWCTIRGVENDVSL